MIKVASYCRVSTDHEDQVNSLAAQQRYFRAYIQSQPEWELYRVYADEGITGTSTKKRTQFNRMISDARMGKFSLILTKEVSRFSRNILDTIAYTRLLRALGIGVIFMTDGINTLDPDAELRLSIMGSIAQEESRKTSARVKWGQTRQMERGIVFGHSLLGYTVTGGALTVEPIGAEIVKRIYFKYGIQQKGLTTIAKELREEGSLTPRGSDRWTPSYLLKILKNEKYMGDLVQRKTYTPDYLTHQKQRNMGQEPVITLREHHEPIIDKAEWHLVQERLSRNNRHRPSAAGHSDRYCFSGKIRCGECGAAFVCRCKTLKDGSRVRRWRCGTAEAAGAEGCSVGRLVRDDDAMQMLKTAIRSLPMDFNAVTENVTELAIHAILAEESAAKDAPDRLLRELHRTRQKKEAMMDAYFSGEITKDDMQAMTAKYDRQLNCLQSRLEETAKQAESKPDPAALRIAIQSEVIAIVSGEAMSETLCKTMLNSLTVFKDRRTELRLNWLPQVVHFTGS